MASIFLYNIKDAEKLNRIRAVALRRGVRLRAVNYEEYGHPLGWLCGREGFAPAESYTAADFTDEMLVLEGLSGRALSELLDALRTARAQVALKAVVTDTNAAWSSAALHAAVLEEHNTMQRLREQMQNNNIK